MTYQVLARKWRPRRFDQVIGQTHIVQALTNALQQQFLHHAYLFTGTRGVGKTTIARLLAKCFNCTHGVSATPCNECECCCEIDAGRFIDLFEVDAASRTKVEDTRELLENVPYAPSKGRFKIYLIDEVHMLSGHSFNALLKTLEEPPAHVKFLLATTDPQKLPPTVLSRCLQFHLLAMSAEKIAQHLQYILQQEHIPCEIEATLLLSKAAHGSMRDALSLLDQSIAYGNGKVLTTEVSTMLGTIDRQLITALLIALKQQDGNTLINTINTLNELGADFNRALADLLALLHQIAVQQLVGNASTTIENIQELAQHITPEDVQLYYQIGLLGQRDLAFAPTPRIGFEMTLLRMLAFTPQQNITTTPQQKITTAGSEAGTGGGATVEKLQSQQQSMLVNPPISANITAVNLKKGVSLDSTTVWHELLPLLHLQGATLLLAQHCELKQANAKQIHLLLHKKHQPLLQQKHIQRINTAFLDYLELEVVVKIEVVDSELETSAIISQRENKQRQQMAEQTISNDPFVQTLKQQFSANILKDTVTINTN